MAAAKRKNQTSQQNRGVSTARARWRPWSACRPPECFAVVNRPGGMEYAACGVCNIGTRGSDAVAALLARIHPDNGEGSWQAEEMRRLISTIDAYAPGVREENELAEQGQLRVGSPSGLRRPPACCSGPRGWTLRQSASQCFRGETGDGAVPASMSALRYRYPVPFGASSLVALRSGRAGRMGRTICVPLQL
jgi:hypothetical protein